MATKPMMKKTYARRRHGEGNSIHVWLGTEDLERVKRIKDRISANGLLNPSTAVLLRAGIALLERYASELIAVTTRAL